MKIASMENDWFPHPAKRKLNRGAKLCSYPEIIHAGTAALPARTPDEVGLSRLIREVVFNISTALVLLRETSWDSTDCGGRVCELDRTPMHNTCDRWSYTSYSYRPMRNSQRSSQTTLFTILLE